MATQSSKVHFYIFMVLIFFLCLLSFSVGTFVGKSVTEAEYRKSKGEISSRLNKTREVAADQASETSKANKTKQIETDDTLSNDEIDQLAEEFAGDETDLESEDGEAPEMKKEKISNTEAIEKPKSPIADVTERISENQAAIKKEVKKRKPSAVLPAIATSSLGKFTVQIASYTSEKEAEAHAAKLKERGYSAFYIPAKIRKKEWYRVSIGLFKKSETANSLRKKFIKKNYLETAIIQKITQ